MLESKGLGQEKLEIQAYQPIWNDLSSYQPISLRINGAAQVSWYSKMHEAKGKAFDLNSFWKCKDNDRNISWQTNEPIELLIQIS